MTHTQTGPDSTVELVYVSWPLVSTLEIMGYDSDTNFVLNEKRVNLNIIDLLVLVYLKITRVFSLSGKYPQFPVNLIG